jgi:hypothetical protein
MSAAKSMFSRLADQSELDVKNTWDTRIGQQKKSDVAKREFETGQKKKISAEIPSWIKPHNICQREIESYWHQVSSQKRKRQQESRFTQ